MGRCRTGLLLAVVMFAIGSGPSAARADVAWIPNLSDDTVSRIDLSTHEAFTIDVGDSPYGIAASPDGLRAYVGNILDGTVSVVDAESMTVIATIPVGDSPEGLAVTPDGTKLYVVLHAGDVVPVDTALLTAGTPIEVIPDDFWGSLQGAAMNPAGTRLYVAKYQNGTGSVAVIDTSSDQVVADIYATSSGYGMRAVSVSADGGRVWAASEGTGEIHEIDAATSLLVRSIPLDCVNGCIDIWSLVPHPDGSRVFVASTSGERLAVIDATAGIEASSIELSGYPVSVDVTPDGSRLYVPTYGEAIRIEIVDTETETVIGSLLSVGLDPNPFGRFITGDVEPPPPPPPPVLGSAAQACQEAIASSWKRFPAKVHKTFSSCFERLLDDVAKGAGTAAAAIACVKNLDPANPTSSFARTRATARAKLLSSCTSVTPAQLGQPCSPDATTFAQIADCVLDAQALRLTETVASEYAAPCSLATAAGLAAMHPGLCAGAP